MPLPRENRAQVRRIELEGIAAYCGFEFLEDTIRDGTGIIRRFGNRHNEIMFLMGLTARGEIKFKFWSNVDLRDENMRFQLVRNWLLFKLEQQQVENTTLDYSVGAANARARTNPEGYVAVYTVNNINGNNWNEYDDDQKNIVRNVFEILRNFFINNVEENQTLNDDIETYNQYHQNELNDYICMRLR